MEQKYTVQPGDTLGKIAAKFYGSSRQYTRIVEANNIKNPNVVSVGTVLTIPGVEPEPAAPVTGEGVNITPDQLKQILPHAKESNIAKFTPALDAELPKFRIATPLRVAQFIAQIGVESASLNATVENLNYSANALLRVFGKYFPTEAMANDYARQPEKIANRVYANRMGNGDEESGDGWRYRGRGLIQLTGKNNYETCGKEIDQPLENTPEIVTQNPNIAVMTACWYWNSRNLNRYADRDDVKKITKLINGGYHGFDERKAFLAKAKEVLGVS